MATINTKTVGSGATRDYSTLANWEAGRQADLTSSNVVEIAELYNDSAFLNDNLAIDGWTTGTSNYIHIKPADGEEHSGILNTGVKFTRSSDFYWNSFIKVLEDYVRIEGIEFQPSGGSSAQKKCLYVYNQNASNDIRIFNCIFYGNNDSKVAEGIHINDADTKAYIYNNILYEFPNWISAVRIESATEVCLYNNTAYGNYNGFQTSTTVALAINNASFSNSNADFSGTFGASSDYNCSSDTSAPGSNSIKSKTASNNFTNVSAGSEDFHVKDNTADIYNAGQDLTSDANFAFNTDIDWQTRPTGAGTWDIGADEIASDSGDMSKITAEKYYSVHKNGLTIITAVCQFRDIMSDFGDRISIDIGRPKEAFTKAIITQVSRHLLDRYRVTITAVAGGYQDNEDEAWEVS